MDVAATTATAAAAASATGDTTAIGRARLAENFDTFLSLLTTQLKNQDPLSPLDSNQFTQQIVQMTGVEQQLATNDLLKKLVSNTTSGIATAVSLIGKEVRAEADVAALKALAAAGKRADQGRGRRQDGREQVYLGWQDLRRGRSCRRRLQFESFSERQHRLGRTVQGVR